MTDNDPDDFDRYLRALVSHAKSDAPRPPAVGDSRLARHPRFDRRRLVVVSSVAAVLIVVGAVVLGARNTSAPHQISPAVPPAETQPSSSATPTPKPAPAPADTSVLAPPSTAAVDPVSVVQLCRALSILDVQVPESYVGSSRHIADLDSLIAIASGRVRDDLVVVRTYIASGVVTAADPQSNVIDNWPADVQASVAAIRQFRTARCGSNGSTTSLASIDTSAGSVIHGGSLRVPLSGGQALGASPFATIKWGDGPDQVAMQNSEFTVPVAMTASEIFVLEDVPFSGLTGRVLVLNRNTGQWLRTDTIDGLAGQTVQWVAAAPDGTIYTTTRSVTAGTDDIVGYTESNGTFRLNGQHAALGSVDSPHLTFTARGVEENGNIVIANDSAAGWPTVTSSMSNGAGVVTTDNGSERHDWAVSLELDQGPIGFADTLDERPLDSGVLVSGTTSQDPVRHGGFIAYLPLNGTPRLWRSSGQWQLAASDLTGALVVGVTTAGLQLGWLPTN